MHRLHQLFRLVFVGLLVAGMTVPVSAIPADRPVGVDPAQTTATGQQTQAQSAGVSVGIGQQLSTVLAVTSDDVKTEVEETAFEVSFESEDERDRVRAVANRSAELRDRAEAIVAEYESATDAYEAGEISTGEYARRIAALNARATNVLRSYDRLEDRSASVSALELRAEGVNRTALRQVIARLDTVTGTGPSAILRHFTGLSQGRIELRADDGLRIEVESEDGESSREVKRRGDGDPSLTISQASAFETASGAISDRAWSLERASVHEEDGYYRFRYRLDTPDQTGRAEVRVDGSSGTVIRIEEEIEARDREDESDEDESDEDLVLIVTDGTPAPGATVTLQVLQAGTPVADVTVTMNDRPVGTTDADGQLQVTLPNEEAELTARLGEAEAELEFEFEADDDADVFRNLGTDVTLEGQTVTVTVTFEDRPVSGAQVFANDRRVGPTGADGTVQFQLPADDGELELEIVKGEFEVELEYRVVDGSLTLTEDAHAGDGDKVREDEEDDADEGDDADEEDDPEREDESDDRDESDEDLVLRLVEGDPAAGATVTIEVLQGGEPASGARVTLNDRSVGTTDANGRIQVTLPSEEARIEAQLGDADGDLEFEFDDEAEEEDDETETPTESRADGEDDDDDDDENEEDDDDDEDADEPDTDDGR